MGYDNQKEINFLVKVIIAYRTKWVQSGCNNNKISMGCLLSKPSINLTKA